jgi:peroxidase
MSAFYRKGPSRCARKQLTLEHLETRQLMAADLASTAFPLGPMDAQIGESVQGTQAQTASVRHATHARPTVPNNPTVAVEIRSIDGTDNNLADPELGSTNEQLLRVAPADYADGVSALAGADRPSARLISDLLAAQDEEEAVPNERALSAFIYIWGQFVDHDIDLTEPGTDNPEEAPISVPVADSEFDPDGSGEQVIPFTRSGFDPATGTSTDNPRQQINEITTWIDASTIYGSDQATADSLRTFDGGKLLTSNGGLPPADDEGFIAGDVRANENVELTSTHALFIREHNRIADELARDNPNWTDEQIYQQARAIVGAEIQVITYHEFLPALLGEGALDPYEGYDPTVDPSIATEFSTAAFRLHTLVNDDVEFFGNDGRAVFEEVALREAFFNPDLLRETGIDSILKYAASTQAQEVDNQLVDGLRNFLFGLPGEGGLDLASLNI